MHVQLTEHTFTVALEFELTFRSTRRALLSLSLSEIDVAVVYIAAIVCSALLDITLAFSELDA